VNTTPSAGPELPSDAGPPLEYRRVAPEDMEECARMVSQSWPLLHKLGREGDATGLSLAYCELCRAPSFWQEIAVASGRPVGLLFGSSLQRRPPEAALRNSFRRIALGERFLRGKYGHAPHPFTLAAKMVQSRLRADQQAPKADAQIELVVVAAAHRGHGVGRTLIDRFVRACAAQGARSLRLLTDPLSDWSFYKAYGFRYVAEFTDPLNSWLAGRPVASYVYMLDM